MIDMGLAVLDLIQKIHTPWLDQLMIFFSRLGNAGMIWIVLTILLLCRRQTRRYGYVCAVALLLSLLLCNLCLKPLLARPRPFSYNAIELLVSAPEDWSFPSGHSSASFAAAMALTEKGRKWAIPAFVLAAIIAFSRLYLYVHFPGDVIGGIMLGLLCGFLARRIVAAIGKRKSEN